MSNSVDVKAVVTNTVTVNFFKNTGADDESAICGYETVPCREGEVGADSIYSARVTPWGVTFYAYDGAPVVRFKNNIAKKTEADREVVIEELEYLSQALQEFFGDENTQDWEDGE